MCYLVNGKHVRISALTSFFVVSLKNVIRCEIYRTHSDSNMLHALLKEDLTRLKSNFLTETFRIWWLKIFANFTLTQIDVVYHSVIWFRMMQRPLMVNFSIETFYFTKKIHLRQNRFPPTRFQLYEFLQLL